MNLTWAIYDDPSVPCVEPETTFRRNDVFQALKVSLGFAADSSFATFSLKITRSHVGIIVVSEMCCSMPMDIQWVSPCRVCFCLRASSKRARRLEFINKVILKTRLRIFGFFQSQCCFARTFVANGFMSHVCCHFCSCVEYLHTLTARFLSRSAA